MIAPKIAATDVLKTTLTISYTKPAGATSFILRRSAASNMFNPVVVYSGPEQLRDLTSLTQNTEYFFQVEATDGTTSAFSNILRAHTFWTPTASSLGGNRIATSGDTALDPFINVGDYLIVGSDSYAENDVWGGGIGGFTGLVVPALAPGKKVCTVGYLGVDYITLDMVNNPGTSTTPVIFTNVGGQFCGKFNRKNFKYVKQTGKYDPVAKTGNVYFQGHDDPQNWACLHRTYGFYTRGQWSHPEMILSSLSGDSNGAHLTYFEIGMGGYSGITIKNDGGTVPMEGVTIDDFYIHDVGGEIIYAGSTQSGDQMPVTGFTIRNGMCVRGGLNGLQIGQMKGTNLMENLVIIGSGFCWNSSFMKFQDQAVQLQPRENGFIFHKNLVPGSAGDFLNWFMQPNTAMGDNPQLATVARVEDNLFIDQKGMGGGYITPRNGFKGTNEVNRNLFGGFGKDGAAYQAIFRTDSPHYSVLHVEDSSGQLIFNASGNKYDNTSQAGGPLATKNPPTDTSITLNLTGNQQVASHAPLVFSNYFDGLLNNNYAGAEQWIDAQCPQWNADNRQGTRFQDLAAGGDIMAVVIRRNYAQGDIVRHLGRFYQSLHSSNIGNQPTGTTDTHWKLLIFSNGSTMPPDDLRLAAGSPYAGWGLTYTVASGGGGTDPVPVPNQAKNLFALTPAVVIPAVNMSFAEAGWTAANVLVVYLVGDPLKSWMPGREINSITSLEAGKGYYMVPRIDMNISQVLTPAIPAGSLLTNTKLKSMVSKILKLKS